MNGVSSTHHCLPSDSQVGSDDFVDDSNGAIRADLLIPKWTARKEYNDITKM